MEKLIELLNEYEKETKKSEYSEWRDLLWGRPQYLRCDTVESELLIISKGYHFIEWLVENDKIERAKFWNSETKSSKYSDFELSYDTPREDYTNILLMELAIQDEPIQFLIGMLR